MTRAKQIPLTPPGRRVLGAALAVVCALVGGGGLAADSAANDVQTLEEQAMQAAVTAVAPSVVRIETVGGLERIGNVLVGTGPTTGLVVSRDGYVISSAFNFAQKPTSILVVLPDGNRVPAELVATDHSRMLVLLKVKTPASLAVPMPVPTGQITVGQWAIALGRTFDGPKPNMSVGIVSALARMWGKAIQTDAKVSPSNYGGPLVDIQGRVLGVLVPLSPQGSDDEIAGVEWYDSGIGFAIPLEHVLATLPRLKQGQDLRPGLLGVSMKRGDLYADEAVIGSVRPKSPAALADLKAKDTIVEINGQPVASHAQMKQLLAPCYAGDTVHLVAKRGEERIAKDIELVAKMPAYQHSFLGILPLREAPEEPVGVTVRYVYPDSPAAQAGMKIGDRITGLDGKPIKNRNDLFEAMALMAPEQKTSLELQRGEQKIDAEVTLATLPEAPPPAPLPAGHGEVKAEENTADVGLIKIKIPEVANGCIAYVPESYNPAVAHGVVIWLHGPGGFKDQELVDLWKDQCAAHDLILLAPKSADPAKWQRTELQFVLQCLMDLAQHYKLDRTRIVVAGAEGGANMAFLLALRHRDIFRGVVATDAGLPRGVEMPEIEPELRQAFFLLNGPHSTVEKQLQADATKLRKLNYPVILKEKGEALQRRADEELADIVRWIDSLDRI